MSGYDKPLSSWNGKSEHVTPNDHTAYVEVGQEGGKYRVQWWTWTFNADDPSAIVVNVPRC